MWCNYVKWICFCCSFLPYNVVFFNKAIFSYDQKRLLCYNSNSNNWEKHQKRFSFPISVSFSEWAKLLTSQRSFAYFVLPLFVLVLYSGANQCPNAGVPRLCRWHHAFYSPKRFRCMQSITFVVTVVSPVLCCSSIFSNLIKKSFGIHPGAMKLQWGASTGAWDALLHTFHCCLRCAATHCTAVWDVLLHASSEALAPLLMRRQLKKENASNWKKSTSKMPFCIHQSNSGKRPVFWRIAFVKTSLLS